MNNKELFEAGLAVRREVVGDKVVEQSLKTADEFSMPMQELVTEFCWGAIWTRPDLDRRSRSIQKSFTARQMTLGFAPVGEPAVRG